MKILLENIHKITECLLCKQNEWYWIQSNFFSKLIIQGYLMKFFCELWNVKLIFVVFFFQGIIFQGYAETKKFYSIKRDIVILFLTSGSGGYSF